MMVDVTTFVPGSGSTTRSVPYGAGTPWATAKQLLNACGRCCCYNDLNINGKGTCGAHGTNYAEYEYASSTQTPTMAVG